MIIIDFYNFLYFKFDLIDNDSIRYALNLIFLYSNSEKVRVIVVFDGIYFRSSYMSRYGNVELVFFEGKAGSYIISRLKNSGKNNFTVVTADREIISVLKSRQKNQNIKPQEFWRELYRSKNELNDLNIKTTNFKKITEYEDDNLDELMKKYSGKVFKKD